MNKIKIFVSYSHQNSDWVEKNGKFKLIPWLKDQLERYGVAFWTDHGLNEHVGESYEIRIKENIVDSDIAILLISQEFASSHFILDKELPWIREEYSNGTIKIIPLLIDRLSKKGKNEISWIFDLQTIPSDVKPMIDYYSIESDWSKIKISVLDAINDKIESIGQSEKCLSVEIEDKIKALVPIENSNIEETNQKSIIKICPDHACRVCLDGELILNAEANQVTKLELDRGTFWLEFVSVDDPQDRYAQKYTFIDREESILIKLEDIVQERLNKLELDCYYFSEYGKYGFIDLNTKRTVIPAKYDYVYSFREGLALVGLNKKYGFVDKTGKEVIPLKYDDAYSFSEGLASVALSGKYGFINKKGEIVIPLKYDETTMGFSNGKVRVLQNERDFCIDKLGHEIKFN